MTKVEFKIGNYNKQKLVNDKKMKESKHQMDNDCFQTKICNTQMDKYNLQMRAYSYQMEIYIDQMKTGWIQIWINVIQLTKYRKGQRIGSL